MQAQVQGFRLSPQQARLWLLQQGGAPGWLQGAIDLVGDVEPGAIARALRVIVARHEILRTRFHSTPGIRLPVQIAVTADGEIDVREADLGDLATAIEPEGLTRIAEREHGEPFALDRGPLVRSLVVKTAERRHRLLITVPALCMDAWSFRNLYAELAGCLAAGRSAAPDEAVQYVQFSEWQNELLADDEAEEGRDFWRSRQGNAFAPFSLPFAAGGGGEPAVATLEAPLDPGLDARLGALAGDLASDADGVLLAAWLMLLGRATGLRDLTVGLYREGRPFEDLHGALGLFARWLPLSVQVDSGMSFRELVKKVVPAAAAAESHQDFFLPGVEQNPTEAGSFSFAFERLELPAGRRAGGLELSLAGLTVCAEPFLAKLTAVRRAGSCTLQLAFDRARLEEGYARSLLQQLLTLLRSAATDPDALLAALDLLDDEERRRLVEGFNDTAMAIPRDRCLHQLLSARAAQAPHAVAVVFEERRLTFGELETRSNRLARHLLRQGAGPDALVPVLLETSPEMVVALLGVLKAGAAYVPVDPRHPRERLEAILRDVAPKFVITQERFAASLEGVSTVLLDAHAAEIESEDGGDLASPATPGNLCYVLYTSGSTGTPKGVMVEHEGVVNYLTWCLEAYRLQEGSGAPVHSPVGFDLTVTSLFAPLLAGKTIVLVPEEQGIEGLAAVLRSAKGFSLLKVTPSHLEFLGHLLRPEDAAGLAGTLVVGGEALSAEQLAFWRANAPATLVINEYGPTETVVGCCVHQVLAGELGAGPLPIGRPIGNMTLYALDPEMRPVPVGAPGEVYIGGVGVARGYLARPDGTAERFVPDPFGSSGSRLYRTGDLARFRPEGTLEYLGRNDGQVKLRGYRIELGEVESAIRRHPSVREAVAMLREDTPGDPRLVGYFTSPTPSAPEIDELRAFLRDRLPEPMVPTLLMRLEALPLTPNGKVDRLALPVPEGRRAAVYVPPQTETERRIADIWQEILHVDKVGLEDNFFELGGHSLLMVQAFGRFRQELDSTITMVELFEYPTVRAMAGFLSGGRKAEVPLEEVQDRADARREAMAQRERRRRPAFTDENQESSDQR